MVAFFLHRLVKLLQDSHTVIEWSEGAIYIYNTKKLETDILPNYYGHSKFTSFLRQLTSYGFHRMPADTGRPELDYAYKNESTTEDLDSILKLKRKQPGASKTANKRNSFKKPKNPKISNVANQDVADSDINDKKANDSLNKQEMVTLKNIPTPCLSLSDDNLCTNLSPILTVPMLRCRNEPNIISRRVSLTEPMTCRSNSIHPLSSLTQLKNALIHNSDAIVPDMIQSNSNCQTVLSMNSCAADEDLQYDNDFNNVLSSLMVADFSEQGNFCSEYEDVLKVIVND